jgi:PEP-CTERM motif
MLRRVLTSRWSVLILALAIPPTARAGPYPPAAGQPGSDALSYQDPRFVEWASGYQNYIQGSPINPAFTDPTQTLGPAKGTTTGVTELGDGGQITLTFASPIVASQSGPDFAVFGNSFDSTYLKLAYVDVSQDGITWYRMPDYSLTPGPVGTFGNNMDPTNIDGLAGKYMVGYGVPFSLSEVGLTWASYVRLVDVVGNGTNLDSAGNPIYDPYPNDDGFNAGGVGVLSDLASVPEPSSIALMLIGGVFVAMTVFRPQRKQTQQAFQ